MGSGFDPAGGNLNSRVLQPVSHWAGGGRAVLGYRVAESGMTLAVAADHRIETADEHEVRTQIDPDVAKHVFRIQATPGTTTRISNVVSYHTSRGVPTRELVDRCRRTLDRARDTPRRGSSPSSGPGWTPSGSAATSRSAASRRCSRRSAGTCSS